MKHLFTLSLIALLLVVSSCSRKQYALFSYKKQPALADLKTGAPITQSPVAHHMEALSPAPAQALVSANEAIAAVPSPQTPSLKQLWQIKKEARTLRKALERQDTLAAKAAISQIKTTLQDQPGPVYKTGITRSWVVAIILCLFLGYWGIHRFYLGYTVEGVLQLLSGGCCGIWWLIDFIRILTKDLRPKGGMYEEDLEVGAPTGNVQTH